MKDTLIKFHDGDFIECDIDGRTLTYTYGSEPTRHYVLTLKRADLYVEFKRKVMALYNEAINPDIGSAVVSDYLQSSERDEFFLDDGYCYTDNRTTEEIKEYEQEAFDKVWLMRSSPCYHNPQIERDRVKAVERILSTYDDIPENGYSDWECGYWNGILGALRWVMGDEKDFLDT